ncbi:MAG: hypothetical protein RIM23_25510 [Coleofasciculus sp. G3-WIS-01]|uniref:hypothetical protein n=1 Tax=Coleofasciculus sp. G3-WIS-01 TaxID=3069528 RepID=UPI003304D6F2
MTYRSHHPNSEIPRRLGVCWRSRSLLLLQFIGQLDLAYVYVKGIFLLKRPGM